MNIFAQIIAKELQLPQEQVGNTLQLLDDGCTIPFISRYRKERTGGLDEVQIASISDLNGCLKEISRRKETIVKTITRLGLMNDGLRQRIDGTWDATELEDIYLPFKPKRRTRAQVARERGLEPLAEILMKQREQDPADVAERFVGGDVKDAEDALQGAKDIIAEKVSEDEGARQTVRQQFRRDAMIRSKVVAKKKDTEGAAKFSDYFDFSEPLRQCSSHRLLAMRRGEAEGMLRVSITTGDEECISRLKRRYARGQGECGRLVEEAVEDGYKRLLRPSIETEFAAASKEKADNEAISVFAGNLRQLLLSAPLGQKRVMGIDPGFRTGCKVVCLDELGNLLHHEAIFPHPPVNHTMQASMHLRKMLEDYGIEAIAIGNGTASRETRRFVEDNVGNASTETGGNGDAPHRRQANGATPHKVGIYIVSEDGASIYSASKLAREEFPDEDVTVRGAVSIARRLMDPLAELVKIDPKSIGVGQYQHDVDQTKLKHSLDQTVEICVNSVGIDLNTASQQLLTYVSGVGPTLARNIVDYRRGHGAFTRREQLKYVPRLGPAAFEQCAGFLRIRNAENPLDNSAVHPESYAVVERMAYDCGCTVAELIADKGKRDSIDITRYVGGDTGLPTLNDIMKELEKPGLDPRSKIEEFDFDPNVREIDDLKEGMVLPGIVTNITNFGAFVDIGVHHDGLVHISKLANRYVKDPNDIVRLHQHVMVKVTGVDLRRNRISLSMRDV